MLGLTGEWHFSRLPEVIGQFNRAIELDPTLSSAYQGLSQALIYTGALEQAVAVGRRAVELGPSDADALLFLGVALFELGEVAEAMELADMAVGLNPLKTVLLLLLPRHDPMGQAALSVAKREEERWASRAPMSAKGKKLTSDCFR